MMRRPAGSLIVGASLAVILAAVAGGAQAADRWQWSITPYMWATDISETVLLDGTQVGGGDTEFKDLVDILDTSLQLHLEGVGVRWGVFADVTYIEASDSETGDRELLRLDVEIEESVLEGGLIWRPGGHEGRLDVLLGARYLGVDVIYRLLLGTVGSREIRLDESYLDALVGFRYHIPLSERWVISLRGDASIGDTDLVWTAQAMVGWRFGSARQHALLAGYRYRDMEYDQADVLDVEKTLSGFGIGVTIGF